MCLPTKPNHFQSQELNHNLTHHPSKYSSTFHNQTKNIYNTSIYIKRGDCRKHHFLFKYNFVKHITYVIEVSYNSIYIYKQYFCILYVQTSLSKHILHN